MIWNILFIFTLTIAILNVFKMLSIMTGNMIELPGILKYKFSEPEKWYIFYPCFFYQAWFWTQYTGLI